MHEPVRDIAHNDATPLAPARALLAKAPALQNAQKAASVSIAPFNAS